MVSKEKGCVILPLTEKELNSIDQQLGLEQLLIKKYTSFANACTDQQLRKKCEQIASQHQSHYNKLLNLLN